MLQNGGPILGFYVVSNATSNAVGCLGAITLFSAFCLPAYPASGTGDRTETGYDGTQPCRYQGTHQGPQTVTANIPQKPVIDIQPEQTGHCLSY